MNRTRIDSTFHRAFWPLLCLLTLLRLADLERDAPPLLTRSGALYTDEGWYAFNAARSARGDNWYDPNDHNLAVNLPVVPLLQAATFRVCGVGLWQARLVSALCGVLLLFVAAGLFRALIPDRRWTRVSVMFLGAGFGLFAYSRLALYEAPVALMMAGTLWAAHRAGKSNRALVTCGAGLCLALAILAKTCAAALIPAFLVLLLRGHSLRRDGIRKLLWAGLPLLLNVVFAFASNQLYPEDNALFRASNFTARASLAPLALLKGLGVTMRGGFLFAPFGFLASLATALVTFRFVGWRKMPLALQVSVAWILPSMGMFVAYGYSPTRYWVPLAVPMAILCAYPFAPACRDLLPKRACQLLRGCALLCLLLSAGRMFHYIAYPCYSLLETSREIAQQVRREGGPNAKLAGKVSDTVSLVTGLPSTNRIAGLGAPFPQVAQPSVPSHYVALLNERTPLETALRRAYRMVEVARWNVMGNYLRRGPIVLYRITPNTRSDACSALPIASRAPITIGPAATWTVGLDPLNGPWPKTQLRSPLLLEPTCPPHGSRQ